MAVLGGYVVAMTNGGAPTSTPMSVIAVSQADATKVANLQPFGSSSAKNSLIPSMVSVDPQNNRIYVMDAGAGKLAGVNLQNGKLSVAWTQDQTTLSFTTLIGTKTQRVLIGTNIPVKAFKGLKHYTTEQVIWRSAQTGKELASSSQFPKMTQGILVTPGYAGLQYFLTADGHIVALQGHTETVNDPEAVQRTSTATPPTANGSKRLPATDDLPQRPRTTSPPRVRIEGVRGSIPLALLQGPISNTGPTFLGLRAATRPGGSCLRKGFTSELPRFHWGVSREHELAGGTTDRDPVGAVGDAPVAGDSVWPVESCQQPWLGGDCHLA